MTYRAHHEHRAVVRLQVGRPRPIPDVPSSAGSKVHPQSMAISGSLLSFKATLKPDSWIAEGRSLAHPHGSFASPYPSFWESNKLVELPQRREQTYRVLGGHYPGYKKLSWGTSRLPSPASTKSLLGRPLRDHVFSCNDCSLINHSPSPWKDHSTQLYKVNFAP